MDAHDCMMRQRGQGSIWSGGCASKPTEGSTSGVRAAGAQRPALPACPASSARAWHVPDRAPAAWLPAVPQGPFPARDMLSWHEAGYLHDLTLQMCGTVSAACSPRGPPRDPPAAVRCCGLRWLPGCLRACMRWQRVMRACSRLVQAAAAPHTPQPDAPPTATASPTLTHTIPGAQGVPAQPAHA